MKQVLNLPFVRVEIGGEHMDFLLDTGASDCVITPETARRLGVPISSDKVLVRTASGERVPLARTVIPKFRIGGAEFIDFPALVYDFTTLRRTLPNLDGVIGFGPFHEHMLTMDYGKGEVVITPGSHLQPDDKYVRPMRLHNGVPQVTLVSDNGRSAWIDIDSGSTGGLEINPAKIGIRTTAAPRPGGLSMGIAGSYRTGTARVAGSLFLGPVELENPVVEVTNGDYRVGGEVLHKLSLTFDHASRLIRIQFSDGGWNLFGGDAKLFSPSRISTGLGFGDDWVVRDVVPGSPAAAAGVRVGDRCLTVEGHSVQNLNDKYPDLLRNNKVLHYQFQRGTKIFRAALPVVYVVE